MQFRVGVKALIPGEKGRYLFLKKSKRYFNDVKVKWDIPGGRLELGESHLEGLSREIKEETGLSLKEVKEILTIQDIFRDPKFHTLRVTFLAEAEGDVKLSDEHSEYRWATAEEIKKEPHDIFLDEVFNLL